MMANDRGVLATPTHFKFAEEKEPEWKLVNKQIHQLVSQLNIGHATLGISWQTGDHGAHCRCYTCESLFGHLSEETAYDVLISQHLLGYKDYGFQPYNRQNATYQRHGTPNIEMMKRNLEALVRSRLRLQAWINTYPMFKLGGGHTAGNYLELPEIYRVILDDSGLFTEVATSEYYIELKTTNIGHPHSTLILPKLAKDGKTVKIMEGTLVINLRGFILEDKGLVNDQYRQHLKELIDILGRYHRLRTGKTLPVYFIYGAKPHEEKTWGIWTEKAIESMEEIGIDDTHVYWLGLGYGIEQTNDPHAYREITQTIASVAMKGYLRAVKGYNIFHSLTTENPNPNRRIQIRDGIRRELREYFMSGDAKRLPRWANPTRLMEPEIKTGMTDEGHYNQCSHCHQKGHRYIACTKKRQQK